MLDKLMLFKCGMPVFPVDLGTMEGWAAWDKIVSDELPGLAYFIDQFNLGPLAAPRYGVKPWHDPEIIKMEEEISPEAMLLQCIKHDLPLILETGSTVWEGSSLDLRNTLLGSAMPSHDQSRKVLAWPGACGTYLGRLSKRFKGITKRIVRGSAKWAIDIDDL
jgi:hypothetical protein